MSPTNLTRRSFMKASALAAGAAALGSGVATVNNLVESDQAYAADEVKLVHSRAAPASRTAASSRTCRTAASSSSKATLRPHVRGPSVPQGPLGIQALYHPNRNKYPMKRVGERGAGEWERISWDEAFDGIARHVKKTRDETFVQTEDGYTVNRTEGFAFLGGSQINNEECCCCRSSAVRSALLRLTTRRVFATRQRLRVLDRRLDAAQ